MLKINEYSTQANNRATFPEDGRVFVVKVYQRYDSTMR